MDKNQIELCESDVCIVGAGPVGIAMAMAFEAAGLRVTLLEAGNEKPAASPFAPLDEIISENRHAALSISACRALGGTSLWWGGRCVPFDDIDFARRDFLPEAGWPIAHAEIARWYSDAAQFFQCGTANFQNESHRVEELRFDTLERWAPRPNVGALYRDRLAASERIVVLLNSEVTELDFSDDGARIAGLQVAGRPLNIRAKYYVLAGGGLGTARLLLLAQRQWPLHFGGTDGPLGRHYMGHISGKIADLVLADPDEVSSHDYFRDADVFARRRFTLSASAQQSNRLFNTAFWIDNPPFHDASHQNAVLSLIWLALAFPGIGRRVLSEGIRTSHLGPKPWRVGRHVANVFGHPLAIPTELVRILWQRFVEKPHRPGYLLRNALGRYPLHYHAEQSPNDLSRVRLSGRKDANGTPQLQIDFRYREEDVESVLRSHETLDANLRKAKRGHLQYRYPSAELRAAIWAQAGDGFHQIGLTRMGDVPRSSVTDASCRVHGIHNLYLATSGVFPSAGQANPTFPAVALGLGVANHLARQCSAKASSAAGADETQSVLIGQ